MANRPDHFPFYVIAQRVMDDLAKALQTSNVIYETQRAQAEIAGMAVRRISEQYAAVAQQAIDAARIHDYAARSSFAVISQNAEQLQAQITRAAELATESVAAFARSGTLDNIAQISETLAAIGATLPTLEAVSIQSQEGGASVFDAADGGAVVDVVAEDESTGDQVAVGSVTIDPREVLLYAMCLQLILRALEAGLPLGHKLSDLPAGAIALQLWDLMAGQLVPMAVLAIQIRESKDDEDPQRDR